MYPGQMPQMWAGHPSYQSSQMTEQEYIYFQQMMAHQQMHPHQAGHYPPGLPGQYQGPASYSSQGSQPSGYAAPRGGPSRGPPSAQSGQQGRGQQAAPPAVQPPAKPSRVLKITNPADGAEVQVEQKKAEKAPSGTGRVLQV